ncbi:MAG: hypothetical protein CL485_09850, partial [Acidobacteria bacterium]|nr:hypothetical protein [Acidobacteriota bacterium]
MSLSRRAVFAGGGSSSANFAQLVTARGREALVAELGPLGGESGLIPRPQEGEIRLTSNENPFGPPPPALGPSAVSVGDPTVVQPVKAPEENVSKSEL